MPIPLCLNLKCDKGPNGTRNLVRGRAWQGCCCKGCANANREYSCTCDLCGREYPCANSQSIYCEKCRPQTRTYAWKKQRRAQREAEALAAASTHIMPTAPVLLTEDKMEKVPVTTEGENRLALLKLLTSVQGYMEKHGGDALLDALVISDENDSDEIRECVTIWGRLCPPKSPPPSV